MTGGDYFAFFLVFCSFLMPLFTRDIGRSKRLLLSIWFVILLHHFVALINSYFFTIWIEADANMFHNYALEIAQQSDFKWELGLPFYRHFFLGGAYYFFGASFFLGCELSIFAFSVSTIIFVKFARLLEIKVKTGSILLWGALPTVLLLGSIPLRESYQTLFFMLVLYFGAKWITSKKITNALWVMLFIFILALWHHVFSLIGLGIFFSLGWMKLQEKGTSWYSKIFAILLFISMVVGFVSVLDNPALQILINQDALETIANLREFRDLGSRADYSVVFDATSWSSSLSTLPLVIVNYFIEPMPWKLSNLLDLYAFLENWLRLLLIYFILKDMKDVTWAQKRLRMFLISMYFSLEILWAFGTTNYGTAIRHHMVGYWLLVLLGWPLLAKKFTILMK